MKVEVPYDPGELVWTFVTEPFYFKVGNTKTLRYVPGPVVEAEIRFVEIILNKIKPHIKYNVKINSGESYHDVQPWQIFSSPEQAEKAKQEVLSEPEYAWLKDLV